MTDPVQNGFTMKELVLRLDSKIDAYIVSSQTQLSTLVTQVTELSVRADLRDHRINSLERFRDEIETRIDAISSSPEASPAGRETTRSIQTLSKTVEGVVAKIELLSRRLYIGLGILIALGALVNAAPIIWEVFKYFGHISL